jgi:hypothetical protein
VRQVEAEKKLKQWEQDAKERELEKLALKHMKDMARQAKKDRGFQVNVEEVKREHKEAADRVVEAVHTALAEGLHQQQHKHTKGGSSKSSSGDGSSGSGSAETAAAVDSGAAAAGSKRKQDAAGAGAAGGVQKKRKPTMLDMVEGSDSEGSEDDSDAE